MGRPRSTLAPLACAIALATVGCGAEAETGTPSACLEPAATYREELAAAPEEVRLGGETPISACLVDGQSPGDIGSVGETVIAVATDLNVRARRDPSSSATVELGYLVSAVQEGATTTDGIHEDLIRRLDAAARFAPAAEPPPPRFERAFGEGYAAGQASG